MSIKSVDKQGALRRLSFGNLTLYLAAGSVEGDTAVSIDYTYTYLGVEYTGMDPITFHVIKPESADEDESRRLIVFEGGQIRGTAVTRGNLAEEKLLIDEDGSTVSLDMREIPPGTTVTVEVILTMNEQEHVVTVTITAEEQDGTPGEPGGEDAGQSDGGVPSG